VVFYELLTGVVPFPPPTTGQDAKNLHHWQLDQQQRGPTPIRQHNHDVERWLDDLVCQCLAFDIKARPQSAAELATRLNRGLTGWRRKARWFRRHARTVSAAAILFVVVAAAGVGHLATRPSFSERQLQAAWSAYHQGEYHRAEQKFQELVAHDPKCADAYFGRARSRVKLGQFLAAKEDYSAAHELNQDPRCLASGGFCLAKAHAASHGLTHTERALQVGLDTAEVHNNLGYSYLRINDVAKARVHLDKAVALKPASLPIRLNRLYMHLTSLQRGEPLDTDWLQDVEQALLLGPRIADAHAEAARLFARQAQASPGFVDRALTEMRAAVECGYQFPRPERDKTWAALVHDPRFKEVVEMKPVAIQRQKVELVLDPITD
jgi:tetratricopeptide (TPR) repeat protein